MVSGPFCILRSPISASARLSSWVPHVASTSIRERITCGSQGKTSPVKYYTPKLLPGWLQVAPTEPFEHFGGKPFGLPTHVWPRCAQCDAPMIHMAQLFHHPDRLDLGCKGRVLFVFMCEGEDACETWDPESGANAVLIVEEADLTHGETQPPGQVWQETEVRIERWVEASDAVAQNDAFKFFDYGLYFGDELDEEAIRSVSFGTKVGSVPAWVQKPEGPPSPFRFVLQLDYMHRFPGEVPTADYLGCTLVHRTGDDFDRREPKEARPGAPTSAGTDGVEWHILAANYGDCGTAYVFVDTTTTPQRGKMLWQCA
jgi:hypothetical protein